MVTAEPLLQIPNPGFPLKHRGKVRDMFDLGERLLLVASDRLSAFDVVFPQGIPDKGRVLTQISVLWFHATRHIVPNHLITTDLSGLGLVPELQAALQDRSMLVRKTQRIDVECVVRGYLAGSGWKEYQQSRTVCGISLPEGLQLNSKLPEPIFTPALKNDVGHDENVSEQRVRELLGDETTQFLKDISIKLYKFAAERAERAGIILADTKFEFGRLSGAAAQEAGGEVILIDEIFTPDSSRFWPQDRYRAGEPIESLDKQPVRDYVERIGWNKKPPAPELPPELIAETSARYRDALQRLRGVVQG